MATVKISALTELTTTATDDELVIVDTSAGVTKKIQVSNLPSTGIASVADDATPQLGGNLDVVTYDIVSTTNRDIDITPNGTGSVVIDGLKYPQADGTTGYVLKTDGAAQLSWVAQTTDTDTTYLTATTSTEGLVKIEDGTAQSTAANTVTTTAGRTYGVQLNGTGQAVVNVPWVDTDTDTDTTYLTATTTTTGLVKIEDATAVTATAEAVSTTTNRTYGVQLNASDQAVVNVPWTDTDNDTTYSAGDGLDISVGNAFSLDLKASGGLAIDTTELKLDLTQDQSWTGSQRGTPSVVTDGTLDLNTANNFKYTPAASPDTLEFTNETAGQSGFITVINASGHTIATGAEVKKSSTWDVSTAGTYLVSYYSDGTTVYLSASAALAT
jgi:hypothetical protein